MCDICTSSVPSCPVPAGSVRAARSVSHQISHVQGWAILSKAKSQGVFTPRGFKSTRAVACSKCKCARKQVSDGFQKQNLCIR